MAMPRTMKMMMVILVMVMTMMVVTMMMMMMATAEKLTDHDVVMMMMMALMTMPIRGRHHPLHLIHASRHRHRNHSKEEYRIQGVKRPHSLHNLLHIFLRHRPAWLSKTRMDMVKSTEPETKTIALSSIACGSARPTVRVGQIFSHPSWALQVPQHSVCSFVVVVVVARYYVVSRRY